MAVFPTEKELKRQQLDQLARITNTRKSVMIKSQIRRNTMMRPKSPGNGLPRRSIARKSLCKRDLNLNENDKLQANARKSLLMKRIYDNQLSAQEINRNDIPLDEPKDTFVFPSPDEPKKSANLNDAIANYRKTLEAEEPPTPKSSDGAFLIPSSPTLKFADI